MYRKNSAKEPTRKSEDRAFVLQYRVPTAETRPPTCSGACAEIRQASGWNTYVLNLYYKYEGRNEGNVLFNDALNTFYLRLYDVRHMVKDHFDKQQGVFYMHHPIIQDNTYYGLCYSRGALARTTNSSMGPP